MGERVSEAFDDIEAALADACHAGGLSTPRYRNTSRMLAALRAERERFARVVEAPSRPPPDSPDVADALARVSQGACLIAGERRRQVESERWSAEHDDAHERGELAIVAAMLAVEGTDAQSPDREPWGDVEWDQWGLIAKHGRDRVRMLSIAGALIAAEIDRLLRALDGGDR